MSLFFGAGQPPNLNWNVGLKMLPHRECENREGRTKTEKIRVGWEENLFGKNLQ